MSERDHHESKSLRTHVALCSMRYTDLSRRLSRVEYLLYGLIALVALGGGPLAELVRQVAFRP